MPADRPTARGPRGSPPGSCRSRTPTRAAHLCTPTAAGTRGKNALPKMYIGNGVPFADASDVNCGYQGLGNVALCGRFVQSYGTNPQQSLTATGNSQLQLIWDTATAGNGVNVILRDGGANKFQFGNTYAAGDIFHIYHFVPNGSILSAPSTR